MENQGIHGSIAEELLGAINVEPYRGIVSYIGRDRAITPRDFANRELNDAMWLDMRNCRLGRKLDRDHVFEFFASYSGEDPADIREGMLVKMRLDHRYYTQVGSIVIGVKGLDAWMAKMSKPTTPADELVIFMLSKLYNRHTVIYNSTQPWTTLLNVPSDLWNLHTKCDIHLVYVGRNMYGVLCDRPFIDAQAPPSVDELISPMIRRPIQGLPQEEPLNLTVSHTPTDTARMEENPLPPDTDTARMEENPPPPDTDEVRDPSDIPNIPDIGKEVEINNSSDSSDNSNESLKSRRSAPYLSAIDNAREKLLSIKLSHLTNAELEKYLGTNKDIATKVDKTVPDSDPLPGTSSGRSSRLCAKPVNYQESSLDDDSDGEIVSDAESDQSTEP